MRLIDEASLEALGGSRPADTLTVWAWRDGSLVIPEPLQVLGGSFQDDAGDSVKIGQKISLTVADPDGVLGAWRHDDPLGVGGTRLQIIYRVGGAGAMNYGWFRIVDNEPEEMVEWRKIAEYGYDEPDSTLPQHERMVPIVTAVVKLEAVDLTYGPDINRFEAPESPGGGATAISEFTRLMAAHFPVVVDPGVTDVAVSRLLIFDRERLEAGQDLLSRVSARYRMGGDGECRVYPRDTAPVWRTEPGNCLVSVGRKQSVDGLYNRWVVEGKDANTGAPIRATASITEGPLKYGGDHGMNPHFYTSEMIATYDQAVAYAQELRAQFLDSIAIELTVETTPRPELQAGDRIDVGYPVNGHVAYLTGRITAIRRAFTPTPTTTALKVTCSYADVIRALSAPTWGQYLTAGLPELTWDRMPGSWGTAPSITWDDLP